MMRELDSLYKVVDNALEGICLDELKQTINFLVSNVSLGLNPLGGDFCISISTGRIYRVESSLFCISKVVIFGMVVWINLSFNILNFTFHLHHDIKLH